jgi:type IV secretory pathway VirB4 component
LTFFGKLGKSNARKREPKNMSALYPWKNLLYVDNDKRFPIILGKSGELSATIALNGKDIRTSPDYELVDSASSQILVLSELAKEEGFYTHHDMTTAPSEYHRAPWFNGRKSDVINHSNNDASWMVKLLSLKRNERHDALVEPVIFVTVSYQPASPMIKLFRNILFGGASKRRVRRAENDVLEALSDFNNKVNGFVRIASDRLGRATRLDANQTCSYCYYILTGLWTELKAPEESGVPFDYLMNVQRNDDNERHEFSVKAINQTIHVRAVTMYGMPDKIRPEFFEDLSMLGGGIRWCTRLILVPPTQVRKEYTEQWKRYKSGMFDLRQKIKERFGGGTPEVDPVQEDLAIEARESVKGSGSCLFGAQLVSSIIIYRTDAEVADREAERVAEYLSNKQKLCTIEDVGTKLAFATTVPGCSEYKGSRDLLPDWPAVSLLPCSVPYTGPDEMGGSTAIRYAAPWQFTINGVFPARVDFGNGQNRHVAITAPVRAGKSTLLQVMIAGILAHIPNPFVYLLDVDVNQSASRIACTAMGGKVLSFADGSAAIQPFRNVDNPDRRKVAKNWVKLCIRAHGFDDRSPAIDKRIEDALTLLARFEKEERTVLNFRKFVQDASVKQCMNPFATGDYAAHVGGNRNVIGEPPYVVVDCTGLMGGDAHAACVISALIDEITFTVDRHQGPVQMFLDEAAQTFPFISQSLKSAYKRWPKKGGGITIVIHNPSDLDQMGDTGMIITQNTGAWVCLHDNRATENPAYKKHLQLTEFQTALLSEMRQGTFMVKADGEARVVQTDLSDIERWVLGQGKKPAHELADRLDAISASNTDYCVKLLHEGGFNEEAEWIASYCNDTVVRFSVAAE